MSRVRYAELDRAHAAATAQVAAACAGVHMMAALSAEDAEASAQAFAESQKWQMAGVVGGVYGPEAALDLLGRLE